MSYQDSDYEELMRRADHFMAKNRFDEAWECIAAIPEDIKATEFSEDFAFFASIALNVERFDQFIRYFKVYFNSFSKADKLLAEDIMDLFLTMTHNYDAIIHPYVVKVIEIVLARFRTVDILLTCSDAYNMIGSHEDAIQLLDEVLDIDPFNTKAWYDKAHSYHSIGDEAKEVECCNYYIALVPDCDDHNILTPVANSLATAGKHEEAIAMLKKCLTSEAIQPEHLAGVHCLIAENYSALSDYRNELIHRKKALDTYPEEVAYWSMLAQYYITSDYKPLKAEKIMIDALVRFPHDPVMYYMFSAVECQIAVDTEDGNKLDYAATLIEKALKELKDNLLFQLLAARIYLLKKEYPTALKHARKAYRIDPNNMSGILYMVLATFGCGKLTEFRKLYRIYAKLNANAREDVLTILPEAESTIDKIR